MTESSGNLLNANNTTHQPNERTSFIPKEKQISFMRLATITVGLLGLQFVWAVELSYGTPYILSLGLSKPLMSLVWLAGPLSGLLVQPLIGVFSDRHKSKFGKRRPFVIGGSILVLFSLVLVAYSNDIVLLFVGDYELSVFITKALTVFSFYVLDFSINAVQASLRALIIDLVPYQQQNIANAFASRMIGFGNLLGYLFGSVNLICLFVALPKKLNFLYNSQFKDLCLIAMLVLTFCIVLNCVFAKEAPALVETQTISNENAGALLTTDSIVNLKETLVGLIKSIKILPIPIQQICNVQFCSWFSWFPFLFYSTSWFEEITRFQTCISGKPSSKTPTETGSFALFIFSVVSLMFSVILPSISSYFKHSSQSNSLFARLSTVFTPKTLYVFSSGFLGVLYLLTYFASSPTIGVLIVALCGISWSVFMWVPFCMIGEFLALFKDHRGDIANENPAAEQGDGLLSEQGLSTESSLVFQQTKKQFEHIESGTTIGIHNIYVVMPQILVSAISSLVFYIFSAASESYPTNSEVARNTRCSSPFEYPIGFVFRLSSIPLFFSAYLASKIKTPDQYK